jgi:hypothetical protein
VLHLDKLDNQSKLRIFISYPDRKERLIEESMTSLAKVEVKGKLDKYLSKTNKGFKIGQERIIHDLIMKFKHYPTRREFLITPSANGKMEKLWKGQ